MKLCTILFGLTVWGTAYAGDQKITAADVPKAVLERVAKKYPAGKPSAFEREREDGKTSYEVKLTDGARKLEVICAPDGTILAEEEAIALDAVPETVRRALKATPTYGSWTPQQAERIVEHEKADAPSYEIKVASGASRAELVFAADGTLKKTERERDKK